MLAYAHTSGICCKNKILKIGKGFSKLTIESTEMGAELIAIASI